MRRPLGERVVELLGSRGAIWLLGIAAGLGVLAVAYALGAIAAGLLALPIVLAATAAVRVRDRVWIIRRRIMVVPDRISRRQLLAIMIAVSIVTGLTSALGWYLGATVASSYDEKLRARFRKKKKKAP